MPDRNQEILDRLGSSDYKNPPPGSWGQSDKTGWGNQGNAGNEGYFQGFESTNEDRTKDDPELPDLDQTTHESTK